MFYVFVDMDGTLIDGNDNPRPGIAELFRTVKKLGGNLIIWSGGGRPYAVDKLLRLRLPADVEECVMGYGGKSDFKPECLPIPSFFIDDMAELVKFQYRRGNSGCIVPFYYGAELCPNDRELYRAATRLKEWRNRTNAE